MEFQKHIGCGTFGEVFLTKCQRSDGVGSENVVVKRILEELRKEFQHLVADDTTWSRFNQEQRMKRLATFLKTGMDGKKKKNPYQNLRLPIL